MPIRDDVLKKFPYPVARVYAESLNDSSSNWERREAIYFCVYQVLRMVCLPLVADYLWNAPREGNKASINSLNRAIVSIKTPNFGNWIELLHTLDRHLTRLEIPPLFPQLHGAIESMKGSEEWPIGINGQNRLPVLRAMQSLRNHLSHRGIRGRGSEEEAAYHLSVYLPALERILNAFGFLADCRLIALRDRPDAIQQGRCRVASLTGSRLARPSKMKMTDELAEALEKSPFALQVIGTRVVPVFPWFNAFEEEDKTDRTRFFV